MATVAAQVSPRVTLEAADIAILAQLRHAKQGTTINSRQAPIKISEKIYSNSAGYCCLVYGVDSYQSHERRKIVDETRSTIAKVEQQSVIKRGCSNCHVLY